MAKFISIMRCICCFYCCCFMVTVAKSDDRYRYNLSSQELEQQIATIEGGNIRLLCKVYPSISDLAFFGNTIEFSTPDKKQKWLCTDFPGEISVYLFPDNQSAYNQYEKSLVKENLTQIVPADDIIAQAKNNAMVQLNKYLPSIKEHALSVQFLKPNSLLFYENITGNVWNTRYQSFVKFDTRNGNILSIGSTYTYAKCSVSTVQKLTRDDAKNIAANALRKCYNARWTHEIIDTDMFNDDLPSLLLVADALGVQRLAYEFSFCYCMSDQFPSWESYDKYMTHAQFSPKGVIAYIKVYVDAQSGEVFPADPYFPSDLDVWQSMTLSIDDRRAFLYFNPILEQNDPYIPIIYLHHTKLWPGTVTDTGNGTWDVAYGENHATLSPTETTVSGKNGVIMTEKPPIIYKGKPYLHYRAVAALTGDTCTWDATHLRLDIRTIPVPDPAAKAAAAPRGDM